MTMPINTNTTIVACIQIHVGDMCGRLARTAERARDAGRAPRVYRVAMLRRLSRRALAAATALAVAAAPAFAETASAGSDPQAHAAAASLLGGMSIGSVDRAASPREIDRSLAVVHQLHAQVVRVEVPWSVMEPLSSSEIDPRALAYTDRVAQDAAAQGVKVIMMLQSTPCWASSAPASLLRRCSPLGETKANSWPPRQPGDFAAFAAFLTKRYGAKLAAIEVWNEPDQSNEEYFAGPSKPARYAALLRAAYPAIKHANAGVEVLGGSLVGSNGAFLRALYAAGIKGYYDALSVHYYNLTVASLRSIHEVQLANGDTTRLWLDEFGWTSCWPRQRIQREQGCVPAATQALNISNAYRSLSRTPYVAAAVLYKLRDSGGEEFGVLHSNWTRKASFSAFSHMLVSPFGAVSPVTLVLRSSGRSVIASGSAAVGDFMELEAFQNGLLRYRALFTLDRFNRFSLTLPAVLGTHGLSVRVFQYRTGSAKSAQTSI